MNTNCCWTNGEGKQTKTAIKVADFLEKDGIGHESMRGKVCLWVVGVGVMLIAAGQLPAPPSQHLPHQQRRREAAACAFSI